MKPRTAVWFAVTALWAGLAAACGHVSSVGSTVQPSSAASATAKVYATPPGRGSAAMAYDTRMHEVLMFGGQAEINGSGLNDTWAWDGKGWTQLHPAKVPPPMDCTSCASMAFDQATGQIVMVEDTVQGTLTWTWNGGNWIQMHPPHGAFGGPITYDAALGKVITWGTLVWDGSDWKQISTAHSINSFLCCLAYDAATRQVLYLGSIGKTFESQRVQTWIFDGHDWVLSSAPAILGTAVAMVEYPPISKVLLVGGRMDDPASGATWAWNGSSWQLLAAASPPVLTNFSLAYDWQRQEVVMFGGIDQYNNGVSDTWVWDGHKWTRAQPATA